MSTPQVKTAVETASNSIDILRLVLDNAFIVMAGVFTAFFMLVVSILLFKGVIKLDLKGLFLDGGNSKAVSATKFWTNVAYFVATVAFLTINIAAPASANLEFIWVAYLGIVASASVATRFLALRYSAGGIRANEQARQDAMYDDNYDVTQDYRRGRNYRGGDRRRRSRDDGAQEEHYTIPRDEGEAG